MDQDILQEAYSLIKAGDRKRAQSLLVPYVNANPEDEKAWTLMYNAVDIPEEKLYCIERVLLINPSNEKAQKAYKRLTNYMERQTPKSAVSIYESPPETETIPKVEENDSFASVFFKVIKIIIPVTFVLIIFALICVYGPEAMTRLIPASTPSPTVIEKTLPVITLTPRPSATPLPTDTPIPSLTPIGGPLTPVGASLSNPSACVPSGKPVFAAVVDVIDSVTIEVSIYGDPFVVRYIGIEPLPEVLDPMNKQGSTINEQLVLEKYVRLIGDETDANQEGQLLRYVFAADKFVNFELVSQGYAKAGTNLANEVCADLFTQAEEKARAHRLGLWIYIDATATLAP